MLQTVMAVSENQKYQQETNDSELSSAFNKIEWFAVRQRQTEMTILFQKRSNDGKISMYVTNNMYR